MHWCIEERELKLTHSEKERTKMHANTQKTRFGRERKKMGLINVDL